MEQKQIIRLGDILKESGCVTEEQVKSALAYQKEHVNTRIGDAMIALGLITEQQLLQALAQRLHMRVVDIGDISVDVGAVEKIPKAIAEKNCLLAVGQSDGMLSVLTSDPTNFDALEDIRQLTGLFLDIGLCEKVPLTKAIEYYYSSIDARKAANKAGLDNLLNAVAVQPAVEDANETPVIALLDSLIRHASSMDASDIHIEPFENITRIRMRVDGVINDFVTIQKNIHESLIARIKILAEMDIAEKRIPQDGHFRFPIDKTVINLRASVIPTVFGEKAVLRLLTSNAAIDHADQFGMNRGAYEKFCRMLKAPNGIIYLTGPTGSGKTTTLYMILEALSRHKVNISTIEDPVEKNLDRVNQMQVNNAAGLTFESGLRALLRQDPDVIMVGETRDSETAAISVRAAITGHTVFSTLHTNDAVSTIVRLKDMGVEDYLIANALTGVVTQRLVRKLCPNCAEEYETDALEREYLCADITHAKRKKGCNLCNYTGYKGRIAIHEVLLIDKKIREMISEGATAQQIRDYAVDSQGMKLLRDEGTELIRQGITSMEEVMKAAYYS